MVRCLILPQFIILFSIFLESCTIPSSGLSGNCVLLTQCPEVQEDFRKNRTATPVVCDKKLRTICCPAQTLSVVNSLSFRGLPETPSQTNNHHFLRLNEGL